MEAIQKGAKYLLHAFNTVTIFTKDPDHGGPMTNSQRKEKLEERQKGRERTTKEGKEMKKEGKRKEEREEITNGQYYQFCSNT